MSHPLLPAYESLQRREAELARAKKALADYLANRNWRQWLLNLFAMSDCEIQLQVAQSVYDTELLDLQKATLAWSDREVFRRLHLVPTASDQFKSLAARAAELDARLLKVSQFLQEAGRALSLLSSAKSKCKSASSAELVDMLSKSKGIAFLSHLETEDAKACLAAASTALKELTAKWPKRSTVLEMPEIENTLDLMLDLAGSLDIMSFFNMMALDDAVKACTKAENSLKQALLPAQQLQQQLTTQRSALTGQREALQRPFLVQTTAELPEPLRKFAPFIKS